METSEAILWGVGGVVVTAMWIKPSPHFSWDELTTTTRTVVGGNQPDTWQHRLNLVLLANLLLERTRSLCGGSGMTITSAYRSAALQAALYTDGTSSTDVSDHETGCAADLYMSAFGKNDDIARVIFANRSRLPVKQCIVEEHTGHLHLAMDSSSPFDPTKCRQEFLITYTGKKGDYHGWSP